MTPRPLIWLQCALMVVVSAILFVGFFRFNQWAFSALEHAQGINWIFLPAGFRVLLVLIMGLPGALGIVAGNLWLDQAQVAAGHWLPCAMAALVSGLGPWGVKQWMVSRGRLDHELRNISPAQLIHFILVYAAVNALFHQFIRWNFQLSNSLPWVDVWPMFVGDVVGALAVLYVFRLSLPWLKHWVRQRI